MHDHPRRGTHDTVVFVAPQLVTAAGLLDLVDVSPAAVHVEWRDPGSVDHLTSSHFLDRWEAEGRCCARGSVSLLGRPEAGIEPVSVLLASPRIAGSALRCTVLRHDGHLPVRSGSCVLVLDPPDVAGSSSEIVSTGPGDAVAHDGTEAEATTYHLGEGTT